MAWPEGASMKLPSHGTAVYKLTKHIYDNGAQTTHQLDIKFDGVISHESLIKMLSNNVKLGRLDKGSRGYTISQEMLDALEGREPKPAAKAEVAIVDMPVPRPFKPMTNYKVSALGTREGSNEYLEWKSRHRE
jgi:hypothetical protein